MNCFSTLVLSSEALNETFTYKQALQQPDYHDFIKAMVAEVDDHETHKHWTLMLHHDMPTDTKTVMSIWSFKQKRHPDGALNKHKTCLCSHGGMQTWGQNYWETYAPVVNCTSVHLLLAIAKIHGLPLKSVDFVLSFPQADLEVPDYVELPIGSDAVHNESCKFYVLCLNKSLYGLWQVGYNWFAKLCNRLLNCGFSQLNIDSCVLWSRMHC